jgi:hypothetical protein
MMDVEDQTGRLGRIYLIVAWAAVVLIAVVSGLVYRAVAIGRMVHEAEGQAVALAQQFIATSWSEVEAFVNEAPDLSPSELREHSGAAEATQALLDMAEDRPVFKARLYGALGLIVASTEMAEIGRYTSDSVVLEMVAGRWWSRGRPDADSTLERARTLETGAGTLRNVDLVVTYVVIRPGTPGLERAVGGVLGIYQNVGGARSRIRNTQALAMGSIILPATLVAGAVWIRWRRAWDCHLDGSRPISAP